MKILSTLLSLSFLLTVTAQENLLDTSFGTNNGYTDFTFYTGGQPSGGVHFQDSAKLPDGKILAVGIGIIARFTENGILDTTLNGTGYQLVSPLGNFLKILPAGDGNFILMDIAFGGKIRKIDADGNFLTSFNTYNQSASYVDIDIDESGRIYLLKHNNNNYFITRLLSDGTADTDFANNGDVALGSVYRYGRLKVNADGEIFAAGHQYLAETNRNILISKFTAGGTVDTTFGADGNFLYPAGAYAGDFTNLDLLEDGKVLGLTSGSLCSGSNCFGLILYRLMPDGTLDTSFYNNGIGVIAVQSNSDPSKVKRLADGSHIISGTGIRTMYVLKIDANGNLDTNFGVGGKIISPALSPSGYPAYNSSFELYDDSVVLVGVYSVFYAAQLRYVGTLRKYFFSESLATAGYSVNDIAIYPNPVTDALNVQSTGNFISYEIFDLNGRRVLTGTLDINSISVGQLLPGVYMLKIRTSTGTFSHKIVKK